MREEEKKLLCLIEYFIYLDKYKKYNNFTRLHFKKLTDLFIDFLDVYCNNHFMVIK